VASPEFTDELKGSMELPWQFHPNGVISLIAV
jgi:hypothetical protein